jgi:hypothetical protein
LWSSHSLDEKGGTDCATRQQQKCGLRYSERELQIRNDFYVLRGVCGAEVQRDGTSENDVFERPESRQETRWRQTEYKFSYEPVVPRFGAITLS